MAKPSKNVKQIESLMRQTGTHWVAPGLYLQVGDDNACSWILRYQLQGRRRNMGLGGVEFLTVADAFAAAYEARKLARTGIDPIDARRAQRNAARLEAARTITFKVAAEDYVKLQEKAKAWSNGRVASIWRASLEQYAYPTLGKLAVRDIDVALVKRMLEPIWHTRAPTAKRVRQRVESILEWATVNGYRTGENPARLGPLAILLGDQNHETEHMAALPYADMPSFMQDLRAQTGTGARALEFCVLTALRTNAVLGAQWSEIDLGKKIWVVPKGRMKARCEHRVPLAPSVVDLLRQLEKAKDGPYVFSAVRGGPSKPVNERAMREVLKDMGRNIDVHGFRSTFRDWASETTNHDANVCEMALAHGIKSKVEAAYRRGDLLAKRRVLMDDWARYCEGRDNVVVPMPMRA